MSSDVDALPKKSPERSVRGSPQLLSLVNRSLLTILAQTLKAEHAVHLGEQGIVSADTDVHTGMNAGAALADQDIAGLNELTVGATPRPMISET